MRDLKHLYELEKLLLNVSNDYISAAQQEGKLICTQKSGHIE